MRSVTQSLIEIIFYCDFDVQLNWYKYTSQVSVKILSDVMPDELTGNYSNSNYNQQLEVSLATSKVI